MKKCPDLLEPYDWWNYAAPVCPPVWVREKVKETRRSVDWHNIFYDGMIVTAIFYKTCPGNGEPVTHVLPGSYEVSKTKWLEKIADNTKSPNE